MSPNTVTLHRILRSTPEKVYRAFSVGDALASWLPPYGFFCTVHAFDFREGGSFRMSFTNHTTAHSHSFGGTFIEVKENEYIRYTDSFEDPNMPGEMITSISLREVMGGTELRITQEGIPPQIPVEMCYLGWQESLEKLAKLVEPVIPDM